MKGEKRGKSRESKPIAVARATKRGSGLASCQGQGLELMLGRDKAATLPGTATLKSGSPRTISFKSACVLISTPLRGSHKFPSLGSSASFHHPVFSPTWLSAIRIVFCAIGPRGDIEDLVASVIMFSNHCSTNGSQNQDPHF